MSPLPSLVARGEIVSKPTSADDLILEAWAQGYLVGSLIIMSFITLANMRRGVLLHKLILLELIMGIWQGFWLFFPSPVYAWWLSVAAIFLNASWSLHNVIAWMKIKPFLSKPVSYIFIGTVILAQPYWVLEIYANFAYFHGVNDLFLRTRPWEALCRDPWWILTTIYLFWVIKTQYEMTVREIIRISPRFTIMLLAMILSIIFIFLDIFSVTKVIKIGDTTGINPFWKFAFVFKCLTDSVVLDDFKMALDRLRAFKISRLGSFSGDLSDSRSRNNGDLVSTWEEIERDEQERNANALHNVRSPDGDYIHASNFPFRGRRKRRHRNRDEQTEKTAELAPSRDSNAGLEPEEIVPSALEDILAQGPDRGRNQPQQPPPMQKKHSRHLADSLQNNESDDMLGEIDYASALRDVQRQSRSSNHDSSS